MSPLTYFSFGFGLIFAGTFASDPAMPPLRDSMHAIGTLEDSELMSKSEKLVELAAAFAHNAHNVATGGSAPLPVRSVTPEPVKTSTNTNIAAPTSYDDVLVKLRKRKGALLIPPKAPTSAGGSSSSSKRDSVETATSHSTVTDTQAADEDELDIAEPIVHPDESDNAPVSHSAGSPLAVVLTPPSGGNHEEAAEVVETSHATVPQAPAPPAAESHHSVFDGFLSKFKKGKKETAAPTSTPAAHESQVPPVTVDHADASSAQVHAPVGETHHSVFDDFLGKFKKGKKEEPASSVTSGTADATPTTPANDAPHPPADSHHSFFDDILGKLKKTKKESPAIPPDSNKSEHEADHVVSVAGTSTAPATATVSVVSVPAGSNSEPPVTVSTTATANVAAPVVVATAGNSPGSDTHVPAAHAVTEEVKKADRAGTAEDEFVPPPPRIATDPNRGHVSAFAELVADSKKHHEGPPAALVRRDSGITDKVISVVFPPSHRVALPRGGGGSWDPERLEALPEYGYLSTNIVDEVEYAAMVEATKTGAAKVRSMHAEPTALEEVHDFVIGTARTLVHINSALDKISTRLTAETFPAALGQLKATVNGPLAELAAAVLESPHLMTGGFGWKSLLWQTHLKVTRFILTEPHISKWPAFKQRTYEVIRVLIDFLENWDLFYDPTYDTVTDDSQCGCLGRITCGKKDESPTQAPSGIDTMPPVQWKKVLPVLKKMEGRVEAVITALMASSVSPTSAVFANAKSSPVVTAVLPLGVLIKEVHQLRCIAGVSAVKQAYDNVYKQLNDGPVGPHWKSIRTDSLHCATLLQSVLRVAMRGDPTQAKIAATLKFTSNA